MGEAICISEANAGLRTGDPGLDCCFVFELLRELPLLLLLCNRLQHPKCQRRADRDGPVTMSAVVVR